MIHNLLPPLPSQCEKFSEFCQFILKMLQNKIGLMTSQSNMGLQRELPEMIIFYYGHFLVWEMLRITMFVYIEIKCR